MDAMNNSRITVYPKGVKWSGWCCLCLNNPASTPMVALDDPAAESDYWLCEPCLQLAIATLNKAKHDNTPT